MRCLIGMVGFVKDLIFNTGKGVGGKMYHGYKGDVDSPIM